MLSVWLVCLNVVAVVVVLGNPSPFLHTRTQRNMVVFPPKECESFFREMDKVTMALSRLPNVCVGRSLATQKNTRVKKKARVNSVAICLDDDVFLAPDTKETRQVSFFCVSAFGGLAAWGVPCVCVCVYVAWTRRSVPPLGKT